MRNLKKVLALVVAVAMIASMGLVASAASYSDVAANASYADAVNLLSNLGIIKGYEDGTFKPDNTVTRAEAATMIVRMLALDDEVETGATNFTDVAADNWASGYVNVAEANGIINGMGDGTFNPNGEVTYGQIVKMIVCALGYEPVALANGGYLGGGYLYAGSSQVTGFTKGVAGTANAAASRATVARLIYNALEVKLMEQDSFSTGINGSEYKVSDKTILSEYLELEKVEGVITYTYLADETFTADTTKTIDIAVTKNYSIVDEDEYKGDFAEGEIAYDVVVVAEEAATLLGQTVVAYVGDNEDGDAAVFAVAAKSGKNSTLVLDTDLIVDIKVDDDALVIEYWKSENAKAPTTAEIQDFVGKVKDPIDVDMNGIVNGFLVDLAAIVGEKLEDQSWKALEEITLLDNDNDGDFEFVLATIPAIEEGNAVEFVVAEIESEDEAWYFEDEDGNNEFEIDYEDEDVIYTVIKDGKIVDASAIVEGDVITVLDDTKPVLTVYVSSVVVEGTVDEVEDTVYTIAGKEYEVSPISATAVGTLDAGDEGLFYVNASGKIAYVDTVKSIAGSDYVYVIAAKEKESTDPFAKTDKTYYVQVVTATGAVEILTIKTKNVDVFGDVAGAGEDLKAADAFGAIEDYLGGAAGIARIKTNASGELVSIYLPGSEDDFMEVASYGADNDEEYNEARGTYGNKVDLTADVLVFHVDTTVTLDDDSDAIDYEEAVTVTTVGKLFADETSYEFIAYGEEEEVPGVLVVTDANPELNSEAPVMVVTKKSDVVVDEDETVKLTGIYAGEKVSVIVDPDFYAENEVALDAIEKGDVLLYVEAGEFVEDVTVVYNANGLMEATADILVNEQKEDVVTVHFGEITAETSRTISIDDVKFWYGDDVNVTVIDSTGYDVTIEAGSLSSVNKSSNKYTMEALVKTEMEAEDVITDVVIFRAKVAE